MKIFITGASGFLGQSLTAKLVSEGHEIVAPSSRDCDLTKVGDLDKFSSVKFDRVFHLAAWTQAGDFCLKHPGEQWIINQKMNTNVLEWWQSQQPQAKLIAIGTSCCYEPGTPHTEDRFMTGLPTESLFTYAMTKRMLLAGMQALAKQYQLKYLFVVPSTLYGPFYHLDGRQMHFIFDLMRKIINAKRTGERPVLWGDGKQIRELIFVDDFVQTTLLLADKFDNEIFNIGAGRGHSIKEFAELISKQIGYDPNNIQYDTSKYVGALEKVLVTDKVHKALPGLKLTTLEQGLKQTIEWFQQAYK